MMVPRLLLLPLFAAALVTAAGIRLHYYPQREERSLTIHFPYEGADPGKIEHDLLIPFEERIKAIPGIRSVYSSAEPGKGRVVLELTKGTDGDRLYPLIHQCLKQLDPLLPAGAALPRPARGGRGSTPDFVAAVPRDMAGDRDAIRGSYRRALGSSRFLESGRFLETGRITLQGLPAPAQLWHFRHKDFLSADLGYQTPLRRWQGESSPAILQSSGTPPWLWDPRLRELTALPDLPLSPTRTLQQTAVAGGDLRPERAITRLNGQEACTIAITAGPGVPLAQFCRQAAATGHRLFGSRHRVLYSKGERTRRGLAELFISIAAGLISVTGLTFLMLGNLNAALLAAGSLPFSLVCAVALMRLGGGSLDIFSLTGLAVANGLVIDGALFILTPGEEKQAAPPAREPLFYATLTTLAVFLPAAYMSDYPERTFTAVAGALSWTLTAGFLYSALVIPLFRFPVPKSAAAPRQRGRLVLHLYRLGRRKARATRILFGASWALLLITVPAAEFSPVTVRDGRFMEYRIELPAGTPPQARERSLRPLEKQMVEIPGVMDVISHSENDQVSLTLLLSRRGSRGEIQSRIKELQRQLPRGEIRPRQRSDRKSLDILLRGRNYPAMRRVLREWGRRLPSIAPGSTLIRHYKEPPEGFSLTIKPHRLAAAGYSGGELYRDLFWRLQAPIGLKLYEPRLDRTVHVRLTTGPSGAYTRPGELLAFPLKTGNGPIPVKSLATLSRIPGEGAIYRENGRRVLSAALELGPRSDRKTVRALLEYLENQPLPEGCTLTAGRNYKRRETQKRGFLLVLMMAAGSLFLILLFYFRILRKVLQALIIGIGCLGLPLLIIVSLRLPLSAPCFAGLLIALGVQVNNGIMLLKDPSDQASLGGRLRRKSPAIIGSALTSACGIIPLLFLESDTRPFMLALLGTASTALLWGIASLPLLLGAFCTTQEGDRRGRC